MYMAHIGRVKWFNNSQGYGFITYTVEGGECDIFVHHSGIKVAEGQYKYLVPGEYVDFDIVEGDKTHADNVTGVKGGKLMCETRAELAKARAASEESGEAPEAAEGDGWQTKTARRPGGGARGGGGRGRGGRGYGR